MGQGALFAGRWARAACLTHLGCHLVISSGFGKVRACGHAGLGGMVPQEMLRLIGVINWCADPLIELFNSLG